MSEQTLDQITSSNAKALADMSATAQHLGTQNAVSNQQHIQSIIASSLQAHTAVMSSLEARVSRFVLDTSAEEALGFVKQMGSSVADQQILTKIAQSTSPQTGEVGVQAILQQLAEQTAIQAQQLGAMNTILQNLAATSKAA